MQGGSGGVRGRGLVLGADVRLTRNRDARGRNTSTEAEGLIGKDWGAPVQAGGRRRGQQEARQRDLWQALRGRVGMEAGPGARLGQR